MVVTGVVTYALLLVQKRGFRPLELVIGGMVGVDRAQLPRSSCSSHRSTGVRPRCIPFCRICDDAAAATIAVGIVGRHGDAACHLPAFRADAKPQPPSTMMRDRRTLVRFSNRECIAALALAGLVNMAMVMMASGAFHAGHPGRGGDRDGVSHAHPACSASAAASHLPGLADRLGRVQFGGRHDGPARSSCRALSGSGSRSGCAGWPPWRPAFVVIAMGCERDLRPGDQPGRAELRVADPDGRPAAADAAGGHHGRVRNSRVNPCRGHRPPRSPCWRSTSCWSCKRWAWDIPGFAPA